MQSLGGGGEGGEKCQRHLSILNSFPIDINIATIISVSRQHTHTFTGSLCKWLHVHVFTHVHIYMYAYMYTCRHVYIVHVPYILELLYSWNLCSLTTSKEM